MANVMDNWCGDAADPVLDDVIQRRLGATLRGVYETVTSEAIPDRHVELLLALRHKERSRQRRRFSDSARRLGEA